MIQFQPKPQREEGAPQRFVPGELVRHRRYGYRGVVVAFDLACAASESWYRSNRSQPKRAQPWYHVLVDGAAHTTYAAEENLMADESPVEIRHPLLEHFFSGFADGYYLRNDRPWGSA